MTTIKKFKSKKVSNQYTRYFDVKNLLHSDKSYKVADCTKAIGSPRNKQTRTQTRSPGRSVSTTIQWQPIDTAFVDDARGSPYLLLSEDDTLVNEHSKKRRRQTTCHNVLHEPRLKLDPAGIEPLIRGIRISICVEHTRFPLIAKVTKGMGLTHVPEHRLWNVQWCDNTPHFDLLKSMKRFQQINHFPGMSEICRKDLLSRNLNRMLKMYPGDYRIFPKTWLLPTDTYDVAVYLNKHKRTFILKPYSSGQGRGIWLTNTLRSVGRQEKLICQSYVDKPLLIDGYKFDLRVYTLVTSVDPLRIFVYNEGLARFATHKYKPPALGNSNNMFMHLTNYCVNRRNSNYDAGSGNDGGSKRKLSAYNKWLVDHNYSVDEFWAAVDDAIIKTVISAWPVLKHNYHLCFPKHDKIQACFQLLGFDILVDWKLKPYILEVNHTPSLSGGEPVDYEVKRPLIRDTLNLISTPLVDKEEIIREDRAQLRDRLMRQQAHRRSAVTPSKSAVTPQRAAGGADLNQACSLGALAQQIAWEESHLGNYRRIMPPTNSDRVNYYFKFYNQYKEVSMFKENNTSKGRIRLNREHLKQQKLQQQLLTEQDQLHRLRQRKQKLQHIFLQNNTQNFSNLLKQKRMQALAIAKDIHLQKARLLQQNAGKERVGIWQMVDKQQVESNQNMETNPDKMSVGARIRNKRSMAVIKSHRRTQRHQLQRRARRARRLERESRLDAEFLAKHAVNHAVGGRLQAGSSKIISTSSKVGLNQQHQQKQLQLAARSKPKPRAKAKHRPAKKIKSPAKLAKQAAINKDVMDWMPQPINEADKQLQVEWRTQRTAAVNCGQFKEVLFHEMYERGHLTKNDIKQFPNLLYRILRNEINKDANVGGD
ncbi:tubulin polyglutamylase ttll6 [Drosophila novamexicana]|uniref:tubulin polyglutamylase ttll6 n=1 Tax=Drosophila novamexicana TaxID=47314 RepID=UPI0011E5EFEC|nr:tubulin polyglutamylase ttll6 [Drosophila novamexicana]